MKKVHFYPWDGGTEADTDMPDFVLCHNEGIMEDYQLSTTVLGVTCKRCLRILADEKGAAHE